MEWMVEAIAHHDNLSLVQKQVVNSLLDLQISKFSLICG